MWRPRVSAPLRPSRPPAAPFHGRLRQFRACRRSQSRPAIGSPDEYWGVSLGTGFSLGRGENKIIIDIAYIYSWGNDVMGTLVPGQQDSVGTDVRRHDLYLSCIYHF
ncbi:MAG: hypothetical protein PHU80_02015 [Kiritimatiellae bacterium]|nr:hypothetical protein [Kiritimatiellia bacterium]